MFPDGGRTHPIMLPQREGRWKRHERMVDDIRGMLGVVGVSLASVMVQTHLGYCNDHMTMDDGIGNGQMDPTPQWCRAHGVVSQICGF